MKSIKKVLIPLYFCVLVVGIAFESRLAQAEDLNSIVCIAALPKCDESGNPTNVAPTSACYADSAQVCKLVAIEQCQQDKRALIKSYKDKIRKLNRRLKRASRHR